MCISSGGKILIVSTKKQTSEQVSTLAKKLPNILLITDGLGMLTNWNTIQNSIKKDENILMIKLSKIIWVLQKKK